MFAIVEIAGLQYKVEQDQKLFVNRLKGDKGGKVSFDKVLLTVNGAITVGAPAVNGITVEAEILDHVKADKVIVFKKKRRKGYKVKNGHRQSLTQIVITGITGFEGGAKKAAKKETVKGEVLSDNATVNFSEDHELNYHLKKNNLSQSKENRETLITLGKAVKVELEKNILTHEEVDAAIIKNIDQFKALNK
ncbi:50S ribosomal protein L21 [Chryseobacterium arthrosphaerae]|uniref:Large ribosomal subunit protein bL21 n=1 Tax=Chryseobacterium arthrosphaerae TaxID=651561 RepID=A0ABU7QV72_9FLAO|nr:MULTISPECIES: 50S ribosomal protein L21 [Chryseobacterium]AYZ14249.1 50S ribosomal protein L21 [Chryseobacterium arthrosphaerae]MDG4653172.1 50S ribosomal protein L21 [Chryseobacterium arthrosphaerae]NIF07255.1 50S ribosomal protein L21 [Chryseobacterium sp. Tr-659]QUY55088.1 50S ribosomal protein L21 [Chryseobacterium arthrosphaerae]UEQ74968.1 50S ribosomal protein L21 [Chryseobacterium arthrosphaerae]